MNMSWIEIVGHLAFMLTAISFLLKDMILLRLIAGVSAVVGITYNYLCAGGPNWLPIFWLSLFALINGVRIGGIIKEQLSIHFTEDEKELYETIFSGFTPVEYMKLMRFAEWKNTVADDVLATQGRPLDGVYLLYNGEVKVQRENQEVGRSRDGALIGEMSFIQGDDTPASATVTTTVPSRCVFWPKAELRGLLRRNPTIDVALKHVFSVDLAKKLSSND
tara:strand:+ start:792 stop:1451 length:660 start_codon:yes stop_codon:yes gene_type:complete